MSRSCGRFRAGPFAELEGIASTGRVRYSSRFARALRFRSRPREGRDHCLALRQRVVERRSDSAAGAPQQAALERAEACGGLQGGGWDGRARATGLGTTKELDGVGYASRSAGGRDLGTAHPGYREESEVDDGNAGLQALRGGPGPADAWSVDLRSNRIGGQRAGSVLARTL